MLLGGKENDYKDKDSSKIAKKVLKFLQNKKINYKTSENIQTFKSKLSNSIDILSAEINESPNNQSIVVKLNHKKLSCIVLGDAEGLIQEKLLENVKIKSEIHVVSHHGSQTKKTNTKEWIKTVGSKYYVISSGMHKKYKHPKEKLYKLLIKETKIAKFK